MRTIKFRAWIKTRKRMINVYHWHKGDDLDRIEVLERVVGKTTYTQAEYVLMQFTGLKDKNGKEIYESDVIKITSLGDSRLDGKIEQVFWWHGQFVFKASDWQEHDYINFGWWIRSNEMTTRLNQIEVIGNIYENPELLNLQ